MIPLHQLPLARWRKIMQRKDVEFWLLSTEDWKAWKEAEAIRQKRQRWIYGFITATVLALIGFLVTGGCR